MKRKCILAIIMAIVFTVYFAFSILSVAVSNNLMPVYIEQIISDKFESSQIMRVDNVYAIDDIVIGKIITFRQQGYIIYDENDIFELSTTYSYPLDFNKTIYYTGPLKIYQKNDSGKFIDMNSNRIFNKGSLLYENTAFKEKLSNISIASTFQSNVKEISTRAVSEDSIPYLPRTYSYNPDGRCGSLALAITLMYYRDHIDSNVVPNWIATADNSGQYFSTLLKPHVEDINSNTGSSASDLKSGANWYFSYRGINSQYNAIAISNPTYNQYKARIIANRPVIVLINSHPTYSNHWIVGYGYYFQQTGNVSRQLIVVNNGWGSNGIEINFSYVVNLVYFNI